MDLFQVIKSPIHIYKSSGDFTIQLIVFNSTSADTTSQTISIISDNPHFGKYSHENGYGGAFEFLEDHVLILSGPNDSVAGSYKMTSATTAEINLGGYGNGEFTNDFKFFKNPQGTWSK